MQERSFASVILSYFLVGGGLFAGTLLTYLLKIDSEILGYGLMAVGAFVGGFFAARASRGSTILEPAIGAVLVVGTIVGLAAVTDLGQAIWHIDQHGTTKFAAIVGATSVGGALIGAFLSEQLLGEATLSAAPWVLYIAMASFGACSIALVLAAFANGSQGMGMTDSTTGKLLGVMAAGCLVAGAASGASARIRPLLASLVGGAIGVAGFFVFTLRLSSTPLDKDAVMGVVVLAVGGAVATLIGTSLGWAAVGKAKAG